jgi:hypothetical protein
MTEATRKVENDMQAINDVFSQSVGDEATATSGLSRTQFEDAVRTLNPRATDSQIQAWFNTAFASDE